MEPDPSTPTAIEFGRFSVLPRRRELLADGRPLDLGGRAFDMLMVLIEASGAVVSERVLMERVWPNRIVEKNSVQAQISALRRAFGPDRDLIRTIAGRGYQFTGEIRTISASREVPATAGMPQSAATRSRPPTNLPEPVSELIGRDAELDAILDSSASHRLVTLTGAGGIGKTRLGFEAARRLLPGLADGVWAIELAPLSDPELVAVTVATSLGLELTSGTASPQSVANALRSKQLLLVLDNCEHVLDAAARMAEALLRSNAATRVIATSREPLRIEGEWIYPVPPLAVPAEDSRDGEDPLRYGAVRLFVERVRAAAPHFLADAYDVAVIAGICRRLDGIPLAIELAAARAAILGIDGVAAGLDDRFGLLAGGRRTALPRHQTLQATLDWSYELLTEPERVVLRRLAIFAGGFTMQAANKVVADDAISAPEVVDCVTGLVAKSLVSADSGGTTIRYRLLETTRAYALEKLVQAGEFDAVALRHAERYRDLFEGAEADAGVLPTDEWLPDYVPRMDNVRAALDWAFSPGGDASIGVELTAAAVPLWMHLSLMEECRDRVERALAAIAAGAGRDERREMKLYAALGASLMETKGPMTSGAAWTRVFEIAQRLDDAEYQLRSLLALWFFHNAGGRHRVALTMAERFCSLAASRSEPNDRLIGEQMIGASQHHLGDQPDARCHIERALAHYVPPVQKSQIIRFQRDMRVTARVFLSRILWLQGFPNQAMRTAESGVADARATNYAISLCYALSQAACPIALLVGDLAAAEHYVGMLVDHSARHLLARWNAMGRSYQGVLAIKRGDLLTGLSLLRSGLDEVGAASSSVSRLITFLMAEALGAAGQIADRLAAVDEAIEQSERTEERWLIAELLRIKGELLLLQDTAAATAAVEDHFRQALDWARRQGALMWELRAATSLARLMRDQGRSDGGFALLQAVYDQFTEGFATADLKAAKALLDDLS